MLVSPGEGLAVAHLSGSSLQVDAGDTAQLLAGYWPTLLMSWMHPDLVQALLLTLLMCWMRPDLAQALLSTLLMCQVHPDSSPGLGLTLLMRQVCFDLAGVHVQRLLQASALQHCTRCHFTATHMVVDRIVTSR